MLKFEIRTCFESIFKQGLKDEDIEIIIVNDGTNIHLRYLFETICHKIH